MSAAKRQSAVEAEVIIQNPFIDDLTEFCASDAAGSRTCQSTEKRAGYPANSDPRRAGNESDDSANLSTGHGACDPLGGTTDGAYKGADFPS